VHWDNLRREKETSKKATALYESLYESSGDLQAVARLAQIYIDQDQYDKSLKYLLILSNADEDNLNVRVKSGSFTSKEKITRKRLRFLSKF